VTVAEAEQTVLEYVRQFVPDPRSAPSPAIDRHRPDVPGQGHPELDGHLHYRMVDVSSIKELCRRWYPKVYYAKPEKGLAHRALADIEESLRELRLLPGNRVRRPAWPDHGSGQVKGAEVLAEPVRSFQAELGWR